MKKIFIQIRTLVKFSLLITISIFLILGVVAIIYKPIYSVTLNGEVIGYCKDKSKLQTRINNYMEHGDESTENSNLAFISIDKLPSYKMCLLKRGINTNDEEIFKTVVKEGIPYYKYYAILDDDDEKIYVSNFEKAEKIIKKLKEKESNNIKEISIIEKYEKNLKDFTDVDTAVSKLYEKKTIAKVASTRNYSSGGRVSTARNMSRSKINLGVSLSKPISGTISSRFGSMSRVRSGAHTGLDIAAPYGTKIKAAAPGKVVFAGYKGAYGKMIAIDHGNGVMTYYGHCSSLIASVGQKVSQGTVIAAVGSTGNSTGNHLHLEIRVNGVAYNPQNYLY